MKIRQFGFVSALIGATLVCIGVIGPCARTVAVAADEPKTATPQVVLADTYNAVTRVYFNNTAVHKGSHKPGPVERRFRADVKYWLMDAKYYDRRELSVAEIVRLLDLKPHPEAVTTAKPFATLSLALLRKPVRVSQRLRARPRRRSIFFWRAASARIGTGSMRSKSGTGMPVRR